MLFTDGNMGRILKAKDDTDKQGWQIEQGKN